MKNPVTKAVWFLPLSAVLVLINYLWTYNSFNPTKDFKFIDVNDQHLPVVTIHIKEAVLNILAGITFLAGMVAVVYYILKVSGCKPVTIVLPFLFIATCTICWNSVIRIFNFILGKNTEGSQMSGYYAQIPIGYIGTVAGLCCYAVLFYSMYKSKLFPGWIIIISVVAYLARLSMWEFSNYSYSESLLIIQYSMFILVYFFIAREVNTPSIKSSEIKN